MTDEQRNVLVPLKLDLTNKYILLDRARELKAPEKVLIAIRRKIYSVQDAMVDVAVKFGITLPNNWFRK
jgi:hypothetical protein